MDDDDAEQRAVRAATGDGPERSWVTVAVVLVIVLLTGGIAYAYHRSQAPHTHRERIGTVFVTAYFLGPTGAGQRLFSEQHTFSKAHGHTAALALDAALDAPDDPDYHSGFPPGTAATTTVHRTYISIDFDSRDVAGAKPVGGDAATAIQALVWSVEEASARPIPVRFRIKGKPATRLLGAPARAEYTPGRDTTVLSPVSLDLDEGATISWGTLVTGKVDAAQSAVRWQLKQGTRVIRHGRALSNPCCAMVAFQFRVHAPNGNYTLQVSARGRNGAMTTDTKDIEVQ